MSIAYLKERGGNIKTRVWYAFTRGYRRNREPWVNTAVFARDVCEDFNSGVVIYAAETDLEDAQKRVPLDVLMTELLELNISRFLPNWT